MINTILRLKKNCLNTIFCFLLIMKILQNHFFTSEKDFIHSHMHSKSKFYKPHK